MIDHDPETAAELNREPESLVRVRFQDCDPFGHLNNGRYLDYFINAREEHLKDYYAMDIYGPAFQEKNWLVRASMVTHLAPALHNEMVRIRTRLLNYTATGILIEGVMLSVDRSRILAVAWIDFRHVELRTGRPAKHDSEVMRRNAALSLEAEFRFGAEKKRITAIKQDLAAVRTS